MSGPSPAKALRAACLGAALTCTIAPPGARAESRVLMLNSYHPQYEWTRELVEGVREGLADAASLEDLHIEFMDSRRFLDQPAYLDALVAFYGQKYADSQPDVILAADDNALVFLRQHREALFPGVPVVFCGINDITPSAYDDLAGFTGILEGLDVQGNVDLIRRVHPDVRRLIVLSDFTSLGRSMATAAAPALASLEKHGIRHELWDDFTLAELGQRLSELGPEDVVLLLAIHQDRDGAYFSFDEHLPVIVGQSARPIYGMFGMLLGKGIIGGAQNDPREHGAHAAQLVGQLLDGADVDAIPVTVERYRPRFDHRVLDRFDIPTSALPDDAEILFRPRTLWSDYRTETTVLAVLLALLAGVVVALATSLRRQRVAEQALRQGEAQLRESHKMETLGRLAGGIAHDFNNLLTPIVGFADLGMARVRGDAKLASHLESILVAATSASELVEHLLTFSRREATEEVAVDLDGMVRRALGLLRHTVREEIQLHFDSPGDPGSVLAQPAQLERVLINLVVNAADAIEGSGHVWISTRMERIGGTRAKRLGLAGDHAVLEVCDDGCGIAPDDLEHIFDPFFTTKGPSGGTGLGLSTVYGIVRQHGGTVIAQNREDRGTCMSVYLRHTVDAPSAAPPPSANRNPMPHPAGSLGALVLVVEDNAEVRDLVVTALGQVDYRVHEASSAEAALEWLESGEEVDLLLSDITMPGMNGIELGRRVSERWPATRTLFMSGYDVRVRHDLGRRQLIRKPFSVSTLLLAIERCLSEPPSGGA